jgi:hypothetical protein
MFAELNAAPGKASTLVPKHAAQKDFILTGGEGQLQQLPTSLLHLGDDVAAGGVLDQDGSLQGLGKFQVAGGGGRVREWNIPLARHVRVEGDVLGADAGFGRRKKRVAVGVAIGFIKGYATVAICVGGTAQRGNKMVREIGTAEGIGFLGKLGSGAGGHDRHTFGTKPRHRIEGKVAGRRDAFGP